MIEKDLDNQDQDIEDSLFPESDEPGIGQPTGLAEGSQANQEENHDKEGSEQKKQNIKKLADTGKKIENIGKDISKAKNTIALLGFLSNPADWLIIFGLIILILFVFAGIAAGNPNKEPATNSPITQINNTNQTGLVNGKLNVPYYSQTAPAPWHSDPYGSCGTIGTSGCGITSLAMVLTYLTGRDIKPPETAKISVDNGWRVCGSGTAYAAMIKMPKMFNLKSTELGGGRSGWEKNKEYLAKGCPIIQLHHAPSIFTQHGHYIVATGYSGTTAYINDPVYSHKKFQNGVSEDEVIKSMDDSWAICK